MSWQALLDRARAGARLAGSPVHGERHWRAVAALGIELAQADGRADPRVALAFGMLHDCRREAESGDPQHGPRAAQAFADDPLLPQLLGPEGRAQVLRACEIHTRARAVPGDAEPAVAACLDADRLTLGRVGIGPQQRFFSLLAEGRSLSGPIGAVPGFAAWVRRGEAMTDDPPGWEALIARLSPGP